MVVDFSKNSSAPAARQPSKTQAKKPAPPPEPSADLKRRTEAGENVFQLLQMGSIFKGWYADAATYALHGPGVAKASAEYAETNRYMAKALDILDLLGPAFMVGELLLPMGLQLAVNHKRLPAGPLANFGVQEPATLEAQALAAVARQQLEALKLQKEAEAELEAARREAESIISSNGVAVPA